MDFGVWEVRIMIVLVPVRAKSLQLCLTLWDPMGCSHQAPLPMGFSRQSAEVGCPALLQGVFPTQGLNHTSCVGRRVLSH